MVTKCKKDYKEAKHEVDWSLNDVTRLVMSPAKRLDEE